MKKELPSEGFAKMIRSSQRHAIMAQKRKQKTFERLTKLRLMIACIRKEIQLRNIKHLIDQKERKEAQLVEKRMKRKILVFARLKQQNHEQLLDYKINQKTLVITKDREMLKSKNYKQTYEFSFDEIFDRNQDQSKIYQSYISIVKMCMKQCANLCVFAYGQTGSGKTYTVKGKKTIQQRGLIPRCLQTIFKSGVAKAKISATEIHNNKIHNLLPKQSYEILCPEEGFQLLQLAFKNRSCSATQFNPSSSRSHMLFKIEVPSCSIVLVDLAGSEGFSPLMTKEQLIQAKNIKNSLLELKNLLFNLKNRKKGENVLFRGSKLNEELKDLLEGNGMVSMIFNISSASKDVNQTINSLDFSQQVKKIKII